MTDNKDRTVSAVYGRVEAGAPRHHYTLASAARTWGPVVTRLVCDRCGSRQVATVRRDGRGDSWVLVTSQRWRHRMIRRAPRGRKHPDLFDVWPVNDDLPDLTTFCRRHGWLPVPAADVRAAEGTVRDPAVVAIR
jgi:hypothetical protein